MVWIGIALPPPKWHPATGGAVAIVGLELFQSIPALSAPTVLRYEYLYLDSYPHWQKRVLLKREGFGTVNRTINSGKFFRSVFEPFIQDSWEIEDWLLFILVSAFSKGTILLAAIAYPSFSSAWIRVPLVVHFSN